MSRSSVLADEIALRQAINARNLNEAKLLIATGTYVDHKVNPYLDTMLHKAVDAAIVHDLLECGANINAKNLYKRTPLHSAVIEGKTEVLKALLKNQPLVNVTDSKGFTPLHYAVKSRNVEAIKNLVMFNTNINFLTKQHEHMEFIQLKYCRIFNSVLTIAMFQDDLTSIKALIKFGVLRRYLRQECQNYPLELIDLQPCYGMKNYHLVRAYENDCEDEIRRIRSEKLSDWLTLLQVIASTYSYNILCKGSKRMEFKSDWTERLIEAITGNNYPLYHDVIIEQLRGKFQVSGLRNMLLLVQISSVSSDSNEKEPTTLNSNINYILAKYLSKNDLLNLILASCEEPTTYEIKPNLKRTWTNTPRPTPNLKRTLMNSSRPMTQNLKRTLMNTSRPSATIPFGKRIK